MSTINRNNAQWVRAVKAGDVKKSRRALVRLMGVVKRNLTKSFKAGRCDSSPGHKALFLARSFDLSAMRKALLGIADIN